MRICPRFTGIATLLIGLQLFAPKIVEAQVQFSLSHHLFANQLQASSNEMSSQLLAQLTQSIKDFTPPDNGGPDSTQGSGTR